MNHYYARTVFFVSDAERSLRHYTEQLGFTLDWDSHDGVFQVSLFGFELILNDTDERSRVRAGKGRLFIGLDPDQRESLRNHFAQHRIKIELVQWGRPTILMRDIDGNELFFWLSEDEFTGFDFQPATPNV